MVRMLGAISLRIMRAVLCCGLLDLDIARSGIVREVGSIGR